MRSRERKEGRVMRTICQTRLVCVRESHQSWHRGPEDIEVEEADARARREQRECGREVHCRPHTYRELMPPLKHAHNAPAIVLFPTPPFPLATATMRLTFGTGRFSMGPWRRGIVGGAFVRRGRPY